MSTARTRTRTIRSGVEHTNHETTAPPFHVVVRLFDNRELLATTMATATRTSQICTLCTCVFHFCLFLCRLQQNIRHLKQGRRRRLRERNKFAYSVGKNNSFARPARAFHILIHFFAVLVLTTTWNDQIWGHVEDESTWRRIFNFLFNCPHRSHQFYSWIAHSHFPSRTTWSNRKIITVTGNNIFRQRSRSRRRRPCLRSLLRFWRQRERTTENLSVSIFTLKPLVPIYFEDTSPTM